MVTAEQHLEKVKQLCKAVQLRLFAQTAYVQTIISVIVCQKALLALYSVSSPVPATHTPKHTHTPQRTPTHAHTH